MQYRYIFIIILLSALFACSHNKIVNNDNFQDMKNELRNYYGKKDIQINLKNGKKLETEMVDFIKDTLILTDYLYNIQGKVPLSDVKDVRLRYSESGRIDGFLFGLLPGGLVGALVGSSIDKNGNTNTSPRNTISVGVAGAILGGLIGLKIGDAKGSTDVYKFNLNKMDTLKSKVNGKKK